jgi:hypothetical protein
MDKARKKELADAYKEQKPSPGIFAVRCTASGEAWVGKAPDTGRKQSGLWFQLRMGGFPNKALQATWNAHGESAFAFEVLEKISDENPLLIPVLLKEREAHWLKTLNANPFTG